MWEAIKAGHDVKLILGADVDPDEQKAMADWPLIVGQRIDKPDALPVWRRLRARSKLVYEIDDDVFNVEPTNANAYRVYGKPTTLEAVTRCMEAANLVTVTTPYLADFMRQFNDNVAILPNYIPGWVCDLPENRNGHTIGWVGGASHSLDMYEVAGHVRKFLDRFPGWDMHLVGDDFRDTIRHERTRFTRWVPIVDDAEAYYRTLDFDFGIAPLAVGSTFNRSKSHIKALEYAARGIPIIATDMEPYRDFVQHGETGFLVKRDHEWNKYMSILAADEGLRHSMGEKARSIARDWAIEDHWQEWVEAYGRL